MARLVCRLGREAGQEGNHSRHPINLLLSVAWFTNAKSVVSLAASLWFISSTVPLFPSPPTPSSAHHGSVCACSASRPPCRHSAICLPDLLSARFSCPFAESHCSGAWECSRTHIPVCFTVTAGHCRALRSRQIVCTLLANFYLR